MTPQGYPLRCRVGNRGPWFLVVGWEGHDVPVVVPVTGGLSGQPHPLLNADQWTTRDPT